jgi:hypothetical protein
LATELRILILFQMTDLQSLHSLIRASPSYYASFLKVGRKKVLTHLALRNMDERLHVDALAAVRSARYYESPFGPAYYSDTATYRTTDFIEEYGRARGNIANSNSEWSLCRNLIEGIELCNLHEAVKRVANDYCFFIAPSIQNNQSLDLSKMEQLRLYRSIYRFQVYCNFFNNNAIVGPDVGTDRQQSRHPIRHFLPSFSPWEVLEMACVWYYLSKRWLSVAQDISNAASKKQDKLNVSNQKEEKVAALNLDSCNSLDNGYCKLASSSPLRS